MLTHPGLIGAAGRASTPPVYGGFFHGRSSTGASYTYTGPSISGTNTYLIVANIQDGNGNIVGPTGMTYDGTQMTEIANNITYYDGVLSVFGIANPATGKTIGINFGVSVGNCFSLAIYYTGVNQTTPFRTAATAYGASTPATVNVTNSATNDLIVGFFSTVNSTFADSFTEARIGAGQTFRISETYKYPWDSDPSQTGCLLANCEESGASGTVVHSWAYANANEWECCAIPLVPA